MNSLCYTPPWPSRTSPNSSTRNRSRSRCLYSRCTAPTFPGSRFHPGPRTSAIPYLAPPWPPFVAKGGHGGARYGMADVRGPGWKREPGKVGAVHREYRQRDRERFRVDELGEVRDGQGGV